MYVHVWSCCFCCVEENMAFSMILLQEGLFETSRRQWDGDEDMGNGTLPQLYQEYKDRVAEGQAIQKNLENLLVNMERDKEFLNLGLQDATATFQKKFSVPNTSEEKLKALNWEVVEFQTLLSQCQVFQVRWLIDIH